MNLLLHNLGIGAEYIIAVALLLGGLYLLLAWRMLFIGCCVMAAGLVLSSFTYGKSTGGAQIEAQWKAANYEAQLAQAKKEAAIQAMAAGLASKQAQDLANQNSELQQQVSDYEKAARDLPACRRATANDIRRLCVIVGNAAQGCSRSK